MDSNTSCLIKYELFLERFMVVYVYIRRTFFNFGKTHYIWLERLIHIYNLKI